MTMGFYVGWLLVGCWLVDGWLLAGCWLVAGRLLVGCWLVVSGLLVGCLVGCLWFALWSLLHSFGWVLAFGRPPPIPEWFQRRFQSVRIPQPEVMPIGAERHLGIQMFIFTMC